MSASLPPIDPDRDVTRPASRPGVLGTVASFGRMVKFSHTIFALPFALAAGILATRDRAVPWWRWLAIVVAMAGARTAAMGFNRVVDRALDARNPRTAGREIPTGRVSLTAAWALTLASALVFVAAAATLGTLPLSLSPVALLLLFGYSYTKRFTWLCHVFLGLAIAAGPAGAWIALRGDFAPPAAWLVLAVGAWIAGFDVLYALADREFDVAAGLRSIPARFGVRTALVLSAALHTITVAALVALALAAHLGTAYFAGLGLITVLLVWEHSVVRPGDLSRLNVAFFNLNGYVAVAFLASVAADVWLAP